MKVIKYLLWLCPLCLIAATSCRTAKKADSTQLKSFKYSYCTPNISYEESTWQDTLPGVLPPNHLSPHDRLLCNVLGIGHYVNDLLILGKDSLNDYKRLVLKQQIGERVLVAQTEFEAVAAELDCEGERANLAAIYLDNLNSKRNKKLTIGSVVMGALTTVATALISDKSTQTAVGVSGGTLSAGLAVLTINPKGRKIEFYHERNLLKSIWEDQVVNTEYPVFVWKMLHERQFSNSGNITLAGSIKNRWLEFEFNGKIDKPQEKLLFGAGGYYHSDDLHTRSAMLNQLQSTIRSINQDLSSLVVFIEKI